MAGESKRDERRVRVSPRDFILPPYETCTTCGAPELGVLMILDQHYMRRCRACGEAVRVHLPPLRKTIIYVDQFAISDMMKALNPASQANQARRVQQRRLHLFRKLDHLVKLQLIVCPDSLFHRRESEASAFYKPLRRLYELLSGGATFRDEAWIEQSQIRQGFEQWLDGVHTPIFDRDPEFVVQGRLHGWRERYTFSVSFGPQADDLQRRRTARHEAGRRLEDLFRTWAAQPVPFKERVQIEVRAYGETMLSHLADAVQRHARVLAGAEEPTLESLLPQKSLLTAIMMRDILATRGCRPEDQLRTMKDYLSSDAMGMLPFLKIGARLFAALARQAGAGRKHPAAASLLTDVTMVSTLLPYCDAMLVDGEVANLAREAKVPPVGSRGRIFCPKTLPSFMSYLESIESACSREHRALVARVYGPNGAAPFDSVFARSDGRD
jgi:transcription elongation factor Elf1